MKEQFSQVSDFFLYHLVDRWRYEPNVLTDLQTIDRIVENKLSIARYGDGEFNMMLKARQSIDFQPASASLSARLQDVFNSQSERLLVCIPRVFRVHERQTMTRKARRSWCRLLRHKGSDFYNLLQAQPLYGDARISRPYMDLLKNTENYTHADCFFRKIKKIWAHQRVLIVEGALTRWGVGNDLLEGASQVGRILCPPTDAWQSYDAILKAVQAHADQYDLVICALGPTATVLAHDLSEKGIWALDLGHLDMEYEWFLQGAQVKVKIEGKYVNEVPNGHVVSLDERPEYVAQVVERIRCDESPAGQA